MTDDEHFCSEKERIMNLEKRLGSGDVTLATMHQTQLQILSQVETTNGRVSKLERFKQAVMWSFLGGLFFALATKVGITELILEAL